MCARGGETGAVLAALIGSEGVDLHAVTTRRDNGAYVNDRRGGERATLAEMRPATLLRHEVDELYSGALAQGAAAGVSVLAGPASPRVLPADTYRRLTADLRAVGATVVADLSGEVLDAALAGGLAVLKVSHEELIADGRSASDDPAELRVAMDALVAEGAGCVVVSRADRPALAVIDGRHLEVRVPMLECVDHRGAGDAMTAGMAAALARGAGLEDALRLGAAAGALNVTRRGLATGQQDVVERLAEKVTLSPADGRSTP